MASFNRNGGRKNRRELTRIPEGGAEIAFWYKIVIIGPNARDVVRLICISEQAQTYHVKESKRSNKRYEVGEDEDINIHVPATASTTYRPSRKASKTKCKVYCPIKTRVLLSEKSKTISEFSTSTTDPNSPRDQILVSGSSRSANSRSHERLARVEFVPIEGFQDDMPSITAESHSHTAILHLITQGCTPNDVKRATSDIRCAEQYANPQRAMVQFAAILGDDVSSETRSTIQLHDQIKIVECPDQNGEELFDVVQEVAQLMFENTGKREGSLSHFAIGSKVLEAFTMKKGSRCRCAVM